MRIRTALALLSTASGLSVMACGSDVFDTAISDGDACCEDAGPDVADSPAQVGDAACQNCSDASETLYDSSVDGSDSSEADSGADSGATADASMDGGADAGVDSGVDAGSVCAVGRFSCAANGTTPLICNAPDGGTNEWVRNGTDCNFGCDASDGGTGECLRSNPLGYTDASVSYLGEGIASSWTDNKPGSKSFTGLVNGGYSVPSDYPTPDGLCSIFETGWTVATLADLQSLTAQNATLTADVTECQNYDVDQTTVQPMMTQNGNYSGFITATETLGCTVAADGLPGYFSMDWQNGILLCQHNDTNPFATYMCVKSNP